MFKKKSDICLDVVDQRGWTVTHHVVCPLDYGSFDNVHMLKLLCDAGAPQDNKDRTGATPLDLALNNGVMKLSKALQKLTGKLSASTWVCHLLFDIRNSVHKPILIILKFLMFY